VELTRRPDSKVRASTFSAGIVASPSRAIAIFTRATKAAGGAIGAYDTIDPERRDLVAGSTFELGSSIL
jgi:hypothetical protein